MMQTNPRFDFVYDKACAFLLKIGANSLPVNPFAAVAACRWALVSYRELCAELPRASAPRASAPRASAPRASTTDGVTADDIAAACCSKDGITVFSGNNFCIAYNDAIRVKSRISFTLMHEAGHIACGHFGEGRSSLCPSTYKVFEDEANFFAANVLAPAAVVTACGFTTPELLKAACGISYYAAKARVAQLRGWQPRPADDAILRAFATYIAVSRRRAGLPDIRSANTSADWPAVGDKTVTI
jgi:hypothetical protein